MESTPAHVARDDADREFDQAAGEQREGGDGEAHPRRARGG
jgi:hypothetical protein